MTFQHRASATAPPDWGSRAAIEQHMREAHRLRALAVTAVIRSIGDCPLRVARRIRLALLRWRERRTVLAELQGYTDQELQRDLLFPRSDFGRIATEEADRRVAARAALPA